ADLDLPGAVLDPGAAAVDAGRVDGDAAPAAGGARLGEGEEALVLVHDAAPATRGAHQRGGSGLGADALAARAGGLGGEVDRRGDAADGVLEGQVQLGGEVIASAGAGAPGGAAAPATPAPVEQPAEQ